MDNELNMKNEIEQYYYYKSDGIYSDPSSYEIVTSQLVHSHILNKELFDLILETCNEILIYNTFDGLIYYNEYDVIESIFIKFPKILELDFEYDYDQFMFPNYVAFTLLREKQYSVRMPYEPHPDDEINKLTNSILETIHPPNKEIDKLINLFLKYGLDFNKPGYNFIYGKIPELPLHRYMVKFGSTDMVKFLLENGANMNVEGNNRFANHILDKNVNLVSQDARKSVVYCDAVTLNKYIGDLKTKKFIDIFIFESKLSMMLGIKIGREVNLKKNKRRKRYFDYNLTNEILRYYIKM